MLKPDIYILDLRTTFPYDGFLGRVSNRNTFFAFHYDLRLLQHFLLNRARGGDVPAPQDLQAADLAAFISSLLAPGVTLKGNPRGPLSPRSVDRIMTTLECFWKHMAKLKLVPKDDMATDILELFTMTYQKFRPKPLANIDREALVRNLRDGDWHEMQCSLVVLLGYHCGLRVSEQATLEWANVDQRDSCLTCMGKGSKERTLPMTGHLVGLVGKYREACFAERRCKGSPYLFPSKHDPRRHVWPGALQRWVKEAAAWAGIQEAGTIAVHRLRHSCGTQLAESGENAYIIRDFLGHFSVDISQAYVNIANSKRELARASKKAFGAPAADRIQA